MNGDTLFIISLVFAGVVLGAIALKQVEAKDAQRRAPLTGNVRSSFSKVWLELTSPQRSWTAFLDHARGTIDVDGTTATITFDAPNGERYTFDRIRGVKMGTVGTDLANVWVSFSWGEAGKLAWVCDARLLGWRPMFSNSNRCLFDAIRSISDDE